MGTVVRIRERLSRLRLRRAVGVDTHDVGTLRRVIGRTLLVRVVLAGGALALVLAAAASAREPARTGHALVPQDRVGVVVLDLSLSITDDDYAAIRSVLRRLVEEDSSIGLVVFSDVAYELFPPGTPSAELKPLLRLLVAPRLGPAQNPWTQTFRAGTRVSVAIDLARAMLERDEVGSGRILLVSDLETAPDDVHALTRSITEVERSGMELRVVPLAPSSEALALFEGLVGGDVVAGFAQTPTNDQQDAGSARVGLPIVLLVLGLLAFVLLAAHERFSGRLALPRTPTAEASP
jgi:von Willebrand factor type A domain